MRFKFNDDKSRRQIDKANNFRNNTRALNALNMEEYSRKKRGLVDSRGEWELAESLPQ